MSNNNHPHGHLSQSPQNPSWNPLQIPSYIPRQPQLAHMSNERPMVRSPLAWHASAQPPPDAIYNFMSANHKNLDHHHQMNPLLAPPYVSGTLPFDSMDLSLQSSRSAAPPLNKSGLPQQTSQQQHSHSNPQQQQQQQSHLIGPNYPTIHNLSTNTSGQHPQQHLAAMAAAQHAHASLLPSNAPSTTAPTSTAAAISVAPNKYINGSDCESLLPPPPTTPTSLAAGNSNHSSSGSNNNVAPQYMHANRDENFKLAQLKRSFDHDSKPSQKPVELINKDCSYGAGTGKLGSHNLQQHVAASKKSSPLRNYHQQQQQPYNIAPPTNIKYNGPQTPPTPQSPVMQQTSHQMQSPTSHGGSLDYNQLHLHHHLHASGYAQQMQQQQDQPHLHFASHHNQHLPTPIQQQPPPQQQHQHMPGAQYHAQQHSTQQQQQQQSHSRNSTQLTNLDILPKHKQSTTRDQKRSIEDQTVITDLSTSASYRTNAQALPPPATIAADSEKALLPDAPESPYMTTSNEESLESNSNSSSSRKRRKRKSSQVMRLTPSDNVMGAGEQQPEERKRQCTPNQNSTSGSPKQTAAHRNSPKNSVGNNSEIHDFAAHSASRDKTDGEASQANGCLASAMSPHAQVHETGAVVCPTDNGNSSTVYNDDNPKTKKQRQALLQRNLTEQQQRRQHEDEPQDVPAKVVEAPAPQQPMPPSPQSNSSSSSSSSSSGGTRSSHSSDGHKSDNTKATTDTPASPALVEQGNIDTKPVVSVHDDDDDELSKQAEKATPSPPVIVGIGGGTGPCHFEEVEDKLEEMFAGIEDEPAEEAVSATPSTTQPPATQTDLSAQLSLNNKKDGNGAALTPPEQLDLAPEATLTPEVRPMATKAAMKSTLPSPIHSPTPEAGHTTANVDAPESDSTLQEQSSPATFGKTTPNRRLPPRRLSMGMDPTLLRFAIDESPKPKKTAAARKKAQEQLMTKLQHDSDDDKPSTSAAAAAALAARKLSEAAAAQALLEQKTPTPKATNKKKNATAKGKKAHAAGANAGSKTTKNNAKNSKQRKQTGGRKPPSTDEDSTPASTRESNGAADLKLKSPYILIKHDGSVTIKNTHTSEDVNEKQTKVKKAAHERKNLRGMHSSTLSNRYDADTTDSSWICVFCKRGPHKLGLGDLFGPYLVSIDCEEYRAAIQAPDALDIDGMFVSKRKRGDMVKVHARNLPVVPATLATIMQAPKITMHKRKRKQTYDSVYSCSDDQNESQCSSVDPLDCSYETKFIETFRGMCKTSEHGYEVWLHEDCAVWTSEIQLIGAHVQGLDAAVWDSTRYECVQCAQPGANVCCFQRACKAAAHVPCARAAKWSLSESERKVFCEKHSPPPASPTVAAVAAVTTALPPVQATQPTVAAAAPVSVAIAPLTFNVNSLP